MSGGGSQVRSPVWLLASLHPARGESSQDQQKSIPGLGAVYARRLASDAGGHGRPSAESRAAIALSCVIGPARVQSNFPPHICSVKSQVAPGFTRLPTSRTCCWLGEDRETGCRSLSSCEPLVASPGHRSSPLSSCSRPAFAFRAWDAPWSTAPVPQPCCKLQEQCPAPAGSRGRSRGLWG